MWLHIYSVFRDESFPYYCRLCDCLACTVQVWGLPEDDTDVSKHIGFSIYKEKIL